MSEFAESDRELLFELLQMPHWKALKRRAGDSLSSFEGELRRPSADLMGLVRKEAASAKLDALKRFFTQVEGEVEKYQRQID